MNNVINNKIFGTDGVRGVIDKDFNELIISLVTEATLRCWSKVYGVDKVLVGYDTRYKSRDYALIISNVVKQFGVEVLMTDNPTPTPVISWCVKNYKFDLAFQVTASHNPPEYNGVKVINQHGASIPDEDSNEIEKLVNREFNDIMKSISNIQLRPVSIISPRLEYIDYVISKISTKIKPKRTLKIIFDPIHGASIGYTDVILKRLGMDVVTIHGEYDLRFGNRIPDPEPENISEIITEVTHGKYDIGISHDGDGDRLAIIDKELGYLGGNELVTLIAYELARNKMISKGIARTVSTTHRIDEIAQYFNLKIIEVPVGIKYIAKLIINNEVDLGGEESGGVVFSWHVPEKDGIYTSILITALSTEKPTSQIVRDIEKVSPKRFFKKISIEFTNSKKFIKENRDIIIEKLSNFKRITKVTNIDGIKVLYDDGSWILIRGSGTEPKMRIYIETLKEDEEVLTSEVVKVIKVLKK